MSEGQRLKEFMECKKISHEKIAETLRISRTNISKWDVEIPDKHLRRILEVYPDLSANYLIRGIGPMLLSATEENPFQVNEHTLPYNQKCTNPACIKEIEYLQNRAEELRADKIFLQETVEDLRRKVGAPPGNTNSGSVEEHRRTG